MIGKDMEGIFSSISDALKQFGITFIQNPNGTDTYSFIISDEGEFEIKQSISDGTPCVFYNRGDNYEDFFAGEGQILENQYKLLNNTNCIVESLETFTELGEQDFEYYNIKFNNGIELKGISGYYLEVIN